MEDYFSVFMTSGDKVAQLYPQALSTHFSRLLRHEWVTVGPFFNSGHHTGYEEVKNRLNSENTFTIQLTFVYLLIHNFLSGVYKHKKTTVFICCAI
jgi:hypothetical protein